MTRVMVTGSRGFIGQHLIHALASRGHSVLSLHRQAPVAGHLTLRADVSQESDYATKLHGVDTIIHLAACTGKATPIEFVRTNVEGTAALLNAAMRASVARFVFVSSIAVTYPDKQRCHYARSKELAEHLVTASPVESIIVRPTQVFGKGSGPFEALHRLAQLPLVPAFGGAHALMQPIYVSDLAEMLVDLADAPNMANEIIELGGPEVLAIRSVLESIHRKVRGNAPRFVNIPISPLRGVLSALESISVRAVPFTVGQLAAFQFDGSAHASLFWEQRRSTLMSVEEMIEQSLRQTRT